MSAIPIRCKGNRYIPYNQLKTFQGNLKELTDKNAEKLKRSILKYGWIAPIFVWKKDQILDGHGRLLVLAELLKEGHTIADLPVVDIQAKNKKDAGQILLAINSHYQTITDQGLYEFMHEMEIDLEDFDDFELADIDFDDFKDNFFEDDTNEDAEDDVPEPPAKPKSKLGDLYVLGAHRVLCGDATKVEDVERLMDGAEPYLMITDPPYGVEYNANWRNEAERPDGTKIGASAVGKVSNDNQSDWKPAWDLSPSKVAYIYHAGKHSACVQRSLEDSGFEIKCQIIWAKNNFAISRGHYHWKHEPCWYATRKGFKANWIGDRTQTTLWEIDKPMKSETGHSTQKPVECMRIPIQNHEGNVYDPFLGSGTTLIASEKTDRICCGLELDPQYIDVIVQRWVNYTGIEEIEKNGKKIRWQKTDN